jgi:hypothetical protein
MDSSLQGKAAYLFHSCSYIFKPHTLLIKKVFTKPKSAAKLQKTLKDKTSDFYYALDTKYCEL